MDAGDGCQIGYSESSTSTLHSPTPVSLRAQYATEFQQQQQPNLPKNQLLFYSILVASVGGGPAIWLNPILVQGVSVERAVHRGFGEGSRAWVTIQLCQLKRGGEIMHALRWTCIGVGSSLPRRHVHPVSETLTSLKAKVRFFFFPQIWKESSSQVIVSSCGHYGRNIL